MTDPIIIPPIDIISILQRNVIQSLIMVLLSATIAFSQKALISRVMYFILALYPTFYLAGIGIELALSRNWRYLIGATLVSFGTWVWAKGEIKK